MVLKKNFQSNTSDEIDYRLAHDWEQDIGNNNRLQEAFKNLNKKIILLTVYGPKRDDDDNLYERLVTSATNAQFHFANIEID